jgi:hypothetical protein
MEMMAVWSASDWDTVTDLQTAAYHEQNPTYIGEGE